MHRRFPACRARLAGWASGDDAPGEVPRRFAAGQHQAALVGGLTRRQEQVTVPIQAWPDKPVGGQNLGRPNGDAEGVLELLCILIPTVLAWLRPRHDLVLENCCCAINSPS